MSKILSEKTQCFFGENIGRFSTSRLFKGKFLKGNKQTIECVVKEIQAKRSSQDLKNNPQFESEINACKFIQTAQQKALENGEQLIHTALIYEVIAIPEQGVAYVVYEECVKPLSAKKFSVFQNRFLIIDAIKVILQIAKGVQFLHKNGLMHRDLSLETVFMTLSPEGYENIYKIVDFSACTSQLNSNEHIGQVQYMSPERALLYLQSKHSSSNDVLNSKQELYSKSCDIWAIGAILHELITGVPLIASNNSRAMAEQTSNFTDYKLKWEKINHLHMLVQQNMQIPTEQQTYLSHQQHWVHCNSNNVVKFINAMLQINPMNRLTIDQVINTCNMLLSDKNWEESIFKSQLEQILLFRSTCIQNMEIGEMIKNSQQEFPSGFIPKTNPIALQEDPRMKFSKFQQNISLIRNESSRIGIEIEESGIQPQTQNNLNPQSLFQEQNNRAIQDQLHSLQSKSIQNTISIILQTSAKIKQSVVNRLSTNYFKTSYYLTKCNVQIYYAASLEPTNTANKPAQLALSNHDEAIFSELLTAVQIYEDQQRNSKDSDCIYPIKNVESRIDLKYNSLSSSQLLQNKNNITGIFCVFYEESNLDLDTFITQHLNNFNPKQKLEIQLLLIEKLIKGVRFLHSKNITHGRIHQSNIFKHEGSDSFLISYLTPSNNDIQKQEEIHHQNQHDQGSINPESSEEQLIKFNKQFDQKLQSKQDDIQSLGQVIQFILKGYDNQLISNWRQIPSNSLEIIVKFIENISSIGNSKEGSIELIWNSFNRLKELTKNI